jgi:hypothetical protein
MTREQIEAEAERIFPNFRTEYPDGYRYGGFIKACEWMQSQLQSQAEREAIEFAEWLFKTGWVLCTSGGSLECFWMELETINPSGDGEKSTDELYELFKKEREQK